ncbi:hypothetical protein PENARI_c003G07894 [Penicillium arizonense]|uniref:BZIP domain-containing protein n=1 Tax=Penicillium arizonense TaxID=1835702 RepID=A0A1F5LRS2_PENAI|nr:hypothetical protein PENARI_c003G07894 [Penicillium arizonense]OGE55913.1 hypothetical protein PENARI_c003G07894 [Penicillium arizonense]
MARQKKTKIEDLARIRNNQRNCRERRRGYIAELEQKVKYYEKERAQCCTRLQDKAQNLLRENEVLKTLFDPSSVSEDQSLTDRLKRPDADWEVSGYRSITYVHQYCQSSSAACPLKWY